MRYVSQFLVYGLRFTVYSFKFPPRPERPQLSIIHYPLFLIPLPGPLSKWRGVVPTSANTPTHCSRWTPPPFGGGREGVSSAQMKKSLQNLNTPAAPSRISTTSADASRPTKSVQVQGICPNGWVIPNEDDFETLNQVNLSTLRSSNFWVANNGSNSTGFDLRPAGTSYEIPFFVIIAWQSEGDCRRRIESSRQRFR